MKELVRLRMRPSRDKKSFRYMLDYRDQDGKRRQVSLGHADKRRAERKRYEKQLELRMNVAEPISMRLTDFFQDSLIRTKGQVRATTLKERAKTMRDFTECVGDIDVQDVRYQHDERFIQYCQKQNLSAGTITKKVKQLKRIFQLAEDRGQLDRHPLRKLKSPKAPRRKIRVYTDQECHSLCMIAQQYEEKGSSIKWELLIRMGLSTGMRSGEFMNTIWRDIDFAAMTVDVAPKKDREDTWEWHIKDSDNWIVQGLSLHEVKESAGHAGIETTERFYLAVRKNVLDRARSASEASRKGQSVARLLRAPSESSDDPSMLSVSNLKSKL